jgi:CRISPR-associated protein Csm3
MSINFVANVIITGRLRCLTGLHIGATERGGELGLTDNPVIRDPAGEYPYVPGSSLRGRLRSLLAQVGGEAGAATVARIFGSAAQRPGGGPAGPTRLHVRDGFATDETRKLMDRLVREKGLPHVEIKAETALNRITGEASPRWLERVPAGCEFDFSMLYSVYEVEGDKLADIKGVGEVLRGLRLLEDSGLGGGVSRGSGQVAVSVMSVPVVRDARSYLEVREPPPPAGPVPVSRLDAGAYLNTIASALNVAL